MNYADQKTLRRLELLAGMKPRIWYMSGDLKRWVCNSMWATGYGASPAIAFMNWEMRNETHKALVSSFARAPL